MTKLRPFVYLLSRVARQNGSVSVAQLAATQLAPAAVASGSDQQHSYAPWGLSIVAASSLMLATAAADGKVTVTTPSGKEVVVNTPSSGQWAVNVKSASTGAVEVPKLEGPVQLLPPPYPLNALEPHMSQETLEYHWGKHQRTYADSLNKQLAGNDKLGAALAKGGLEGLVVAAWNSGKPVPAFNNAAQVYNHQLFWASMKPGGGGAPQGALASAIERDFKGGLAGLKAELRAAGTGQFGSGWAWLCADDEGNLRVMRTANAVTPLVSGWSPLLVIDVWEHAYYLDFRNRRLDFINAFLDSLVDWGAAEARYAAAVTTTAAQ
eukprot:CAMPEP_0202858936 /NCGR_PEP_ID=MMETSP1391-20130828/1262_1 /ASSEMBLY_ACC=CAM_ASM_000867 /TAXON_ID=1034604 /ORGANISM="Chlamydomonas leiostraca, Strain SAG 11-49" /LENGTH=321 /DNA_ID=CAMNT_0049537919 /DNA_START=21 /DNA_END=986 /DNA_ORIENTATION=-